MKSQTFEDYLLSQLEQPVLLKDGSTAIGPDGKPLTKSEAVATNILNKAMKGDIHAAQFIINMQRRAQSKNQK